MTATLLDRPDATADQARQLTDRIKIAVEATWHLIAEAYQTRAWAALGYASWDDYCTREFGTSRLRLPREERAETVQSLRDSGLSIRAISAATNEPVMTVQNELARVRPRTPEPDVYDDVAAERVDRETGEVLDEPLTQEQCEELDTAAAPTKPPVTGIDGKTYQPRATPRAAHRKPLPDQFRGATLGLTREVARITRLTQDDRFKRNEDQIAGSYMSDLVLARDALQCAIDQFTNNKERTT